MDSSRADVCSLDELLQQSTPLPGGRRSTSTPSSYVAVVTANSSRADAVGLNHLLGVTSDEPVEDAREAVDEAAASGSIKRIVMQICSDCQSESESSSGDDERDGGTRRIGGQLWDTFRASTEIWLCSCTKVHLPT